MSPAPHPPEREPLSEDERALAELLRALPPAEPSPELDARVLAMARAAVASDAGGAALPATASLPPRASARRRPLRRSLGLWLGSAAAAVLAAGLGLQMGVGERSPLPTAPSGPSLQAPPARAERAMEIEMIRRPPSAEAAAPSLQEQAARTTALPVPQRAAEAVAVPQPHMPSDAVSQSPPPPPPPPPPPAPPAPPAATAPAAPMSAPAPAAAGAESREAEPGPTLDRIEVTGSRIRGGRLEGELPPVAADARLKPEDWIERIRERRAAGQQTEARRSLQDFMRSYPYLVVPEDLRPLLHEQP